MSSPSCGRNGFNYRCLSDSMDDRDPETGQISEKFSDEEFLKAVEKYEPASTKEVADEVGCTRRNADVRLKKLEDREEISSKIAGNSLIWVVK